MHKQGQFLAVNSSETRMVERRGGVRFDGEVGTMNSIVVVGKSKKNAAFCRGGECWLRRCLVDG